MWLFWNILHFTVSRRRPFILDVLSYFSCFEIWKKFSFILVFLIYNLLTAMHSNMVSVEHNTLTNHNEINKILTDKLKKQDKRANWYSLHHHIVNMNTVQNISWNSIDTLVVTANISNLINSANSINSKRLSLAKRRARGCCNRGCFKRLS